MADDQAVTRKQHRDRESLLETLESILVAFVLAFVFRAFIIEAFVIPTGSMAATLYGAHAEVTCSDCGYRFAVGAEGPAGTEVKAPTSCVCPHCFLVQNVTNTHVFSGDRILVLKYLYDFQAPQRWDVMVFHNPNDPSQNYIKRVVALPNEKIELQYGNVTINGLIARKPDKAQDALWMLVHDTRYQPHRKEWRPRWVPDSEWQTRGTGFVMDAAPAGDATAWLQYRHWIPTDMSGNLTLSNILDFYGYNSGGAIPMSGTAVCTELGLHTSVTARDSKSVVVIRMRAYNNDIRFDLTAKGSQAPTQIWINGQLAAQAADGCLPVGKAVSVLAANVDQKAMLVVDGRRPAQAVSDMADVTPEGDVIYVPRPLSREERHNYDQPSNGDPKRLASEVDIGARGGPVELAYLRLDRDVYYLNEGGGRTGGYEPEEPGRGSQGNPFALKASEYFVCGDNSPRSLDSRLWSLPRPVVPQRNLVGKAFFVYWPAAGNRGGIPKVVPDPSGWRMVH